MNEEKVRRAVNNSLDRVIEEDPELLRYDVNERSITHRLAIYLDEELDGEWDIDVEYNRFGKEDVSKKVSIEYLKSHIPDDQEPDDLDAKTVYPDIIVHSRGQRYENLLVIEAKKSGKSVEYDREKLTAYKGELRYKHGVLVTFEGAEDDAIPGYNCDWHPFEG